ncbi:hypothetical protein RHO14_11625 [Orbus wheelerorum]|uniref:hypothetical protein n=1 Tax=Orbus wheelerorum TaxID=3074111 RepID=UPI00370DCB13
MYIDKLLISIDIDTTQVEKLTQIVEKLNKSIENLGKAVKNINTHLSTIIEKGKESTDSISKNALSIEERINNLKKTFLSLNSVAAKIESFFDRAFRKEEKTSSKSNSGSSKTSSKSHRKKTESSKPLAKDLDKIQINDKTLTNSKTNIEKTITQVNNLKKAFLSLSSVSKVVGDIFSKIFNDALETVTKFYKKKDALLQISDKEFQQTQRYDKAMKKAGEAIENIRAKIIAGLAPAITKVINFFLDWLNTNKELVTNGLDKTVRVISKIIQAFSNTIQFFDKIISSTIGWKNALLILGSIWLAFNAKFAISPIGAMIVAITTLMFVIDDFMDSLSGGDSLFDGMLGKLLSIGLALLSLIQIFNAIKTQLLLFNDVLKLTSTIITSVKGPIFELAQTFSSALLSMGKALVRFSILMITTPVGQFLLAITAIAAIAYLIYDNWDWLKEQFIGIWDSITSACNDAWDSIASYCSNAWDNIVNVCKSAGKTLYDYIIKPFKDGIAWINTKITESIGWLGKKAKGFLSFFGIGKDNDEKDKGFDDKFNPESINNATKTGANINQNKTINLGDTVNNISINSSDTALSAKQVGDTYHNQLINARNNATSAMGA